MVLFEKVCKFFLFLFGEMVGNTYFRSEFIKVGEVQRQFAVLVSCFSYFFVTYCSKSCLNFNSNWSLEHNSVVP